MLCFQSLPAGTQFNAQTTDVQPSVNPNAICIFVTGQILVRDSLPFCAYAN